MLEFWKQKTVVWCVFVFRQGTSLFDLQKLMLFQLESVPRNGEDLPGLEE